MDKSDRLLDPQMRTARHHELNKVTWDTAMNPLPPEEDCRIEPLVSAISGRWKLLVIYWLAQRTFRFNELLLTEINIVINEPTGTEKFGFRPYNVRQNCSLCSC